MRRLAIALAVLAAGCSSGGESIDAAARRSVVEFDQEIGYPDGFTEDDVEVHGWLTDGDCAGVHVVEPREPGSVGSGKMTVYMRRDNGTWVATDYVTGHGADEHLDESFANCWRDGP